jgi:hypothetical protein
MASLSKEGKCGHIQLLSSKKRKMNAVEKKDLERHFSIRKILLWGRLGAMIIKISVEPPIQERQQMIKNQVESNYERPCRNEEAEARAIRDEKIGQDASQKLQKTNEASVGQLQKQKKSNPAHCGCITSPNAIPANTAHSVRPE